MKVKGVNNMEKNYSESININMGPVQINGTLVSYDENLLKELNIFRNGIDFMLKLYGYEEGMELKEEKADANFPKPITDEEFEYISESLYDPKADDFHGYSKGWLEVNIVAARSGREVMLYSALFLIKDKFKYPNLFFDKNNDGRYASRCVALNAFWMDMLFYVLEEMKKRNAPEDDIITLFRLAETRLHEVESKIDYLFKELKRRSEDYDFINVSTLTKRLDLFKNQAKLYALYEKLPFYKRVYPTELQNQYKDAKIKNTSGKEAPMHFIRTEDFDKLFEMVVSEPFGNKSLLKDAFGFRTRFVGKNI